MDIYVDANIGRASAYVLAPFDEAKRSLEEAKYKIISLEENAKLRVQEKRDSVLSKCACRNCAGRIVEISNVSDSGNWLREGLVYVPKRCCVA